MAAHADRNASGFDPIRYIVEADAASGHQLSLGQWTAHGLDEAGSKSFAGEYFDDFRAEFHRFDDFLHSPCSRHVRDLISVAQTGRIRIQCRTDDEPGTGKDCDACRLGIEHGAGSYDHLAFVFLRQALNHFCSAWNSERDLENSNPSFGARFRDPRCMFGDICANNGDQTGVNDSIKNNKLLNGHGWELSLVSRSRLNYFTRHACSTSESATGARRAPFEDVWRRIQPRNTTKIFHIRTAVGRCVSGAGLVLCANQEAHHFRGCDPGIWKDWNRLLDHARQ